MVILSDQPQHYSHWQESVRMWSVLITSLKLMFEPLPHMVQGYLITQDQICNTVDLSTSASARKQKSSDLILSPPHPSSLPSLIHQLSAHSLAGCHPGSQPLLHSRMKSSERFRIQMNERLDFDMDQSVTPIWMIAPPKLQLFWFAGLQWSVATKEQLVKWDTNTDVCGQWRLDQVDWRQRRGTVASSFGAAHSSGPWKKMPGLVN